MSQRHFSTRQVADALGISESTVKRWCDNGRIETLRTPGGHRRMTRGAVVEFLSRSPQKVIRPEMLELPEDNLPADGDVNQELIEALVTGDAGRVRTLFSGLMVSGVDMAEMGDRHISPVFERIGELWQCGEAAVYQERRACEICERVIRELADSLPKPPPDAPLAMGGATEEDNYRLPTMLAELVLRSVGYRATALGVNLPFSSLAVAAKRTRPSLFWLNVSYLADEARFLDEYAQFAEQLDGEIPIVVGGQALRHNLRKQMKFAAFGDAMQHLKQFALALKGG